MKVLFISSGKSGSVGVVVKNQGESLKAAGVEVDYYTIKPGFLGYLTAIPKIWKTFKTGNYDLAHAHYSFSGFAASLAGCKPLIVSLMGSDAFMSAWPRKLAWFFYNYRWDTTIVKTLQIKELLSMNNAHIIPNGVDLSRFKPITIKNARGYLHYPQDKKFILFISSPGRPEKNPELARNAVSLLHDKDIELKNVFSTDNSEIPYYLNAADLLLLTSKYEGSVNVVKEAMACNCPVVSTDVGDVKWVIGDTEGCFITSFEAEDIAVKIKTALIPGGKTNGRQRIIELGLDSISVSNRIIGLYKDVISNR